MPFAQRVINLPIARWANTSLRGFYILAGLFCATSSALAVAQWAFGWFPTQVWSRGPAMAGLLFNPIHQAQTLAIVIVVLVVHRIYWLIPALLPGLYLAQSRGGWAALVVGLLATKVREPLFYLIVALALGLYWAHNPSSSDTQRLQIWHAAWDYLTLWGNGWGSFMYLFMRTGNHIIRPEYAHNDYLQTVFELGVWSVIPFGLIGWAASRTSATDWPALITFLFMACFSMPLHMPIVAVLGAVAFITTLGATDA